MLRARAAGGLHAGAGMIVRTGMIMGAGVIAPADGRKIAARAHRMSAASALAREPPLPAPSATPTRHARPHDHARPRVRATSSLGSEREPWALSVPAHREIRRRTPAGQERLVCAHAHRTPHSKNRPSRSSRSHHRADSACLRGADERLRLVRLDIHSGELGPVEDQSNQGSHRRNHLQIPAHPRHGRLPCGSTERKGRDLRVRCHDSQGGQNTFPGHRGEQQRLRHISVAVGRGVAVSWR
jgi:hypothetical protein